MDTSLLTKQMQIKQIECGFLGKSAGYYYSIQNIILHKTGWNEFTFTHEDIVYRYTNMNKEMKIEMIKNNDYILLMIDNICRIKSKYLFSIKLNFITEDNLDKDTNFYKLLIVDH
jgi:hypothetical protein